MQKGPLSASPIERVTIIFTAWKERRTFGADNSPTLRSHEYEQVCHNGIFGMDKGCAGGLAGRAGATPASVLGLVP
jgi:hypothetical protein